MCISAFMPALTSALSALKYTTVCHTLVLAYASVTIGAACMSHALTGALSAFAPGPRHDLWAPGTTRSNCHPGRACAGTRRAQPPPRPAAAPGQTKLCPASTPMRRARRGSGAGRSPPRTVQHRAERVEVVLRVQPRGLALVLGRGRRQHLLPVVRQLAGDEVGERLVLLQRAPRAAASPPTSGTALRLVHNMRRSCCSRSAQTGARSWPARARTPTAAAEPKQSDQHQTACAQGRSAVHRPAHPTQRAHSRSTPAQREPAATHAGLRPGAGCQQGALPVPGAPQRLPGHAGLLCAGALRATARASRVQGRDPTSGYCLP